MLTKKFEILVHLTAVFNMAEFCVILLDLVTLFKCSIQFPFSPSKKCVTRKFTNIHSKIQNRTSNYLIIHSLQSCKPKKQRQLYLNLLTTSLYTLKEKNSTIVVQNQKDFINVR